jgi:hypothetical protein
MNRPTISVCLTVYDREESVLRKVFDSLANQAHDQLVIVLDRSPRSVSEYVRNYWFTDDRVDILDIAGKPGWLCPAKAWNEGFARVRSELVYCLSSETIQAQGNVRYAVDLLQNRPAILFGKAECGPDCPGEVAWGDGTPANLLCDSKHPRPLGFIWAGPMSAIRATGGFDEGFMRGHWYDDDDLFYRIWQLGLPFVFTDLISGVHQHHERKELGEEGIRRNLDYYIEKYGRLGATAINPARIDREPGTTTWYR